MKSIPLLKEFDSRNDVKYFDLILYSLEQKENCTEAKTKSTIKKVTENPN